MRFQIIVEIHSNTINAVREKEGGDEQKEDDVGVVEASRISFDFSWTCN